ncbi:MAG TPA: glycosyltransferase [Candidatus Hydrogenedentes bacterium]|nr:glycosyltransferase [Candidatus Hydrogenedentota bacterium]
MPALPVEFVQQLAGIVPAFAKDVFYPGPHALEFARSFSARPHTRVHAISAVDPETMFDCRIVMTGVHDAPPTDDEYAAWSRTLSKVGCLLIVGLPNTGTPPLNELAERLSIAGLALYRHCAVSAGDAQHAEPGYVAFAVHGDYNPLVHARELLQSNHAGWAFDVLSQIPQELLHDPATRAHVAAEKQVCLLAWDRAGGEQGRLERFFRSQIAFYDAVAHAPHVHEVYLCQGEFWRRVGDESMRQRLLRSVLLASRHPRIEAMVGERADNIVKDDALIPPVWERPAKLPRVLFITHPRPHYGLDVLYDGLCTVLGDENVVEYPYKATLHGEKPAELAHYPCMFNRRGTQYTLDQLCARISEGEFDLIIYGDLEQHLDRASALAITTVRGDVPMVLHDAQDDPVDHWAEMCAFTNYEFPLHFKREMLACWDYGARTVPLPFGYADERILAPQSAARSGDLFWAGHRQFGLRRLYLEHLESRFGIDLARIFTQDEYSDALRAARIGLNIFGFGFDTVRYWEVPAHGALLLSERLPIRVPHNFVDGESAVFYDDLPSLEEKLSYWMAHPEESAAIAARGHALLVAHHSASARARQLLAWTQARLKK